MAQDEITFRAPDAIYEPGLFLDEDLAEELVEQGWAEAYPGRFSEQGHPLWRLTPAGREVGRLLTARGRPPAAFADRLRTVRDRCREYEQQIMDVEED